MQIFMDTPLSLGLVCYPTETGSHTKVTACAEGGRVHRQRERGARSQSAGV